jgi:hypothetical protein
MAFFRIKKIKGNEYVYRVENEWKGRTSRQKVKGYLGRACRIEIKEDIQFPDFYRIEDIREYVDENDMQKIMINLVEWELHRHSVSREELKVDIQNRKVSKNGKDVVLSMNGGFLCGFTLANLLGFKKESEEQDANRLARAFVEAGIKIPEEVFIGIFAKLYKEPGAD